jgi:transposase
MSYDIKFRRHVLRVRQEKSLSFAKSGALFGISKQTIYNWSKRLDIKKKRVKPATKIDMGALAQDVQAYPDGYHYERAKRLQVSIRCVGYALGRLGVSYKKNFMSSQKGRRRAFYILPKACRV